MYFPLLPSKTDPRFGVRTVMFVAIIRYKMTPFFAKTMNKTGPLDVNSILQSKKKSVRFEMKFINRLKWLTILSDLETFMGTKHILMVRQQ